ncbi:MAG: ribonuclease D [Candidatus Hodarchaeales archaeon]
MTVKKIDDLVKKIKFPPSFKLISYTTSQRGRRVNIRLAITDKKTSINEIEDIICKSFKRKHINCVVHYHACSPDVNLKDLKSIIESVPNPDAVQNCRMLSQKPGIQFKYHRIQIFKNHDGFLLKELDEKLGKEIIIIDDETGQKIIKSSFLKQLSRKRELDHNRKAIQSLLKPSIHPTKVQSAWKDKNLVVLYPRESKIDEKALEKEIESKLNLKIKLKPAYLDRITKKDHKKGNKHKNKEQRIIYAIEEHFGDKLALEKLRINSRLMVIEILSWTRERITAIELEKEISELKEARDYSINLVLKGYLPKAEYIDSQEDLQRMIDEIKNYDIIAVDIEANSRYTYFENLCLIQFSTIEKDYLVDVLALKDLSPLKSIFHDLRIQKIFHDPRWDVELLKKDNTGIADKIVNIFDTSAAYRALSNPHTSLDKLIETFFKISIDKRNQKADWGKRPLTKGMLTYAQVDTHFLIPMREKLIKLLEQQDRLYLLEDYCRYLETIEPMETVFNPNSFWRIKGSGDLEPQQQAVLREVYLWREKVAKAKNKPPYMILSNNVLIEIAKHCPSTSDELLLLYMIKDYHVKKYGTKILNLVKKGLEANHPSFPEDKLIKRFIPENNRSIPLEESMKSKMLFSRIIEWRKKTAALLKTDPVLVIPKETASKLTRQIIGDKGKIKPIPGFSQEKLLRYGKDIQKIIDETLI